MFFTTSWDDGYMLDIRVGDLLSRHGCTGTFYLCPTDERIENLLTKEQICSLGRSHELGAHTINHPHLPAIKPEEARKEIVESKAWIEQCTGQSCVSFCYPYGDWSPAVREMVKDAGFTNARTTDELQFSGVDLLTLPTSLHIFPFPWRPTYSRWWHPLDPLGRLRARYGRLRTLDVPHSTMTSWLSLAIALFDHAQKTDQPFFHLWGHSHEVERYNQWNDLDAFLAHVEASGVQRVTNGELARLLR